MATVGDVETVISLLSLESWGSLYVRKSWKRWKRGNGLSRLPSQPRRSGLPPQSASLAFPMRAQAALLFPVSFAAPRTRGACNAGLNKYAKKALPYPV